MAIVNFVPEIWTSQLLVSLRELLVYGGPNVVNRNYEGEIANAGDTVNITSLGDPTVGTYTVHTDITIEDVDDTTQALAIDQQKYFAFEVDDVEKRQALGGVLEAQAERAAYLLQETADAYLAGVLGAGVVAGNELTPVDIDTAAEAEQALIDLKVTLDEDNVPQMGRFVVVPPAFTGVLLKSDIFVPADAAGTDEALRNGRVGRAFGFTVLQSNNCPAATTGSGNQVIAGHPIATTFAEQIVSVEAFRMEKRFADGIKGLHLYGAKVTRPSALAAIDTSAT